ncbi:MAG TPA: ABC transporter substrate-binding protein [Methylomirabilota bacterium]|nr:ABC transporter substrate-binding protein [Methylomirabilota bacterium]
MKALRIVVLAALVLAAALAVTAGGTVAQAPPAVKIGYIPSDSFAVLYIMADRYLTPAGINAQLVRLPSGAEITTQVATGQLQVGGAGMGAAGFNAVAAKLPIEFVAPLHFGYLEDYFTVRKAVWGKEVKRIADLKGRHVALNTKGAAVEWMLDQVLRRDGITIKDVQVKIMPFPDMVPALESGAVDAAILTEPFPTLAEGKGVAVRPLQRPAGARAIPITTTFWNAEWARANPDLAHRVMVAYVKAARDLAADGGKGWHEDRNIDIMVKHTNAKREVIKQARPHVIDPNLQLDASTLDSMQKLNAELGYLKYKDFLSADRFFTFTYRDRALAELGRR